MSPVKVSLVQIRASLKPVLSAVLALVVGLTLGLLVAKTAGESPLHVLQVLVKSAFGTRYDLGVTLFYATPLIFCGLSVAVAFHAGLFNIGAEGQITLGALAAAVFGTLVPHLPLYIAPLCATLVAVLVAGFWAWIAGWLRAHRGSHEVINTIMLNFIAFAIASYVTTNIFQNTRNQNPETADMGDAYFIRAYDPVAKFFGDAPAGSAFLLAILMALALWFVLWKTSFGFQLRATGENETAAKFAGIPVAKIRRRAMFLAGAFAGLVAYSEVMGNAARFRLGFSADYGFIGIAVALLAQNNPIGIIFTGILFAALHKGAADLDIETEHITHDLSVVIQALVILSVSLASLLPIWWAKLKKTKGAKQ